MYLIPAFGALGHFFDVSLVQPDKEGLPNVTFTYLWTFSRFTLLGS